MTRLQKKCLVFSLAAHGLLVAALFLGAAFAPKPPVLIDDLQIVDLSATKLVDEALSGGGDPAPPSTAPPTPAPAPAPATPPEVNPLPPIQTPEVKPEVKPVKTPDPPEPETVEKPKNNSPDDWSVETKPKPSKKPFVLKPVKRTTVKETADDGDEADAKAAKAAEKARNAQRQRSQSIGSALNHLQSNLSSGTTIESVGTGTGGMGGGEAYANWMAYVKAYYEDRFFPPDDCAASSVAEVRVTIARDGRVLSDEILRSSHNSAYDRSVRDTLQQVRKVPAFPEGATDTQRSLRIYFKPRPKRFTE